MGLGFAAGQEVTTPRITGLVLVRNEDLTVGRAVRNAAAFCDEWIFCDHGSTDGTLEILRHLASEVPSGRIHRIAHPRESHELIRGLAGQNRWIFGLDGDEIYDPAGLARLRGRLLAGEFARWWMILGNVLHVTRLDDGNRSASGYFAPPCRSMTKLYNFAAIESWDGYCVERLHGGTPVFRNGFDAGRRLAMHESTSWDSADFRCLHLCFQARSSRDDRAGARPNIMETFGPSRWFEWLAPWRKLRAGWKQQRYMRGPEVTVDATPFFGEPSR